MGPLWTSVLATSAMTSCYALFFMGIERIWPAVRGQPRFRTGFATDLAYVYLFVGISYGLDAFDFAAIPTWLGTTALGPALDTTRSFVGSLPLVAQSLIAVFVADFTGYWKHRLHHTRLLWRFHAVHHSSEQVDWLSNERVHPVEGALTAVFHLVPLLVLGFGPTAILIAAAVRRTHSIYEHSNLDVSYGRWERVFVSPHLHRWHHSSDPAVIDKNYANVFSLFDWLFGTLRLQPAARPERLGLTWMPAGLWAQLGAPFRRLPRSLEDARDGDRVAGGRPRSEIDRGARRSGDE